MGVGGKGKVLGPSPLEEPFLPGPLGTGKFLLSSDYPLGSGLLLGPEAPTAQNSWSTFGIWECAS